MEMDKDKVDSFLAEYFKPFLTSEIITQYPAWDSALFQSGVIDSYGIVELITAIESQFKIRIEDEEVTLQNFNSLSRLGQVIREKIE